MKARRILTYKVERQEMTVKKKEKAERDQMVNVLDANNNDVL